MKQKFRKLDAKGILASCPLPEDGFDALWQSIYIPQAQKDRLHSQGILNYMLRGKVAADKVPLHGVILLVGPPGNGKTSLARGLASQIARSFNSDGHFGFIEVEPHSTTSAMHGKTQQAVLGLLSTISEVADQHPLIVLLDEVETLAANRSRMSMETNPVDVHRATDAILAQIDHLAAKHPNLLFIATSNFSDAIDEAFLSRADLIDYIEPPDEEGRRFIIKDTLEELARAFPGIRKLISGEHVAKLAEIADGLDGRRLRKAVVNACASDKQTAADIERLTFNQLQSSFKKTATTKISSK